jgi:hypothetical protein
MNISLLQGIRVLQDEEIKAAIEELAEEVQERLDQDKTARKHHVKDMLMLIKTIPNERIYWRSVVKKRDREIEILERALKRARDYKSAESLELRHEIEMQKQYEAKSVQKLETFLEESAQEMEELRLENTRLLKLLGEWAHAKGIGPGQSQNGEDE